MGTLRRRVLWSAIARVVGVRIVILRRVLLLRVSCRGIDISLPSVTDVTRCDNRIAEECPTYKDVTSRHFESTTNAYPRHSVADPNLDMLHHPHSQFKECFKTAPAHKTCV